MSVCTRDVADVDGGTAVSQKRERPHLYPVFCVENRGNKLCPGSSALSHMTRYSMQICMKSQGAAGTVVQGWCDRAR